MKLISYILFIAYLLFGVTYRIFAQQAEHLPPEINSEFEEREPTFSPDGKTFYFWRRNAASNVGGIKDNGDIWMSKMENGKWSYAVHPAAPLNTPQQNFVWQVSPKNDTIWVNRILLQPGMKDAGIAYHVRNRNGEWGFQRSMEIEDYSYKGNYKDYVITPKRVLIITNIGDDSYGGTDLYACFPINDTTWGKPINLGVLINTPGDEDAPFLAADGKTLFFNSNGFGNGGDHNIYYAERIDDTWTRWTKPKPIGKPINTSGYDFDFQIDPAGKYAYWGSDQNTFGGNDIFRLDLQSCALTLYPEFDVVLCKGDSLLLEAGFTMGTTAYKWLKDGVEIPKATERGYVTYESGDYQVIRLKGNCIDTSALRNILFKDAPSIALTGASHWVCEGDSVLLVAVSEAGNSYQWLRNGMPILGQNKARFYPKVAGEYAVRVSNGNCDRISEVYRIQKMEMPIYLKHNRMISETDSVQEWEPLVFPNYATKDFNTKAFKRDMNGNMFLVGLLDDKNSKELIVEAYTPTGGLKWSNRQKINNYFAAAYADVDGQGNLYVSTNDHYIVKYGSNGSVLWSKGMPMEMMAGIATDPMGNVITVGRFTDTLMIDGNEIIPGVRGNMFVAKHNTYGKLQWIRVISTEKVKDDTGNMVDTDCSGNIYVVGEFERIANFANPVLRADKREDHFFLAKYAADGRLDWAKKVGASTGSTNTADMQTDCTGNITLLLNNVLYRYNNYGGVIWNENVKSPETIRKARLFADGNNVYVCGITQNSNEYFLLNYDLAKKSVNPVWQGHHASDNNREVPSLLTDDSGNLYFAGSIKGRAILGTSPARKSGSSIVISCFGTKTMTIDNSPVSICEGDSVVLKTKEIEGVKYIWYKNNKIIPRVNASTYTAKQTGEYKVQMLLGTCEPFSPTQMIRIDCNNKNPKPSTPPVAAKKEDKPLASAELPKKEKTTEERDIPKQTERKPEKATPPPVVKKEPKPEKPDLEIGNDGEPKSLKKRRVKHEKDVIVHATKVKIYVWDYAAEDRDTISLNINGNWVLQNYGLVKQKKMIEVEFKPKGDNYILLYAHNLGRIPPNTMTISIDDGKKEQILRLESNLNTCGYLRIKSE